MAWWGTVTVILRIGMDDLREKVNGDVGLDLELASAETLRSIRRKSERPLKRVAQVNTAWQRLALLVCDQERDELLAYKKPAVEVCLLRAGCRCAIVEDVRALHPVGVGAHQA